MIPTLGEWWSGYRIRNAEFDDAQVVEEWFREEQELRRTQDERKIDGDGFSALSGAKDTLACGRWDGWSYYVLEKMEDDYPEIIGVFGFFNHHFNAAYMSRSERGRHLGTRAGAILVQYYFQVRGEKEIRTSKLSSAGDKMFKRLGFQPKGSGDPGRIITQDDYASRWATEIDRIYFP